MFVVQAVEQILGGQYIVDVYINKDLRKAEDSDKLSDTINYEEVYRMVKEEMDVPANLIEHVCKRILSRIVEAYPTIMHIRVRVNKLNPPLKGTVQQVYVELEERFD